MPRIRKSNKHLPPNVYSKHGAYYYVRPSSKKWVRLGKSFSEAIAAWAKLVNPIKKVNTMNQLFDRYMIEIAPTKAKKTYKANLIQIKPLRIYFGNMEPTEVTSVDIYKYIDMRCANAKVGANREKSLLSTCFSYAIRWGIAKDNPCRHVKRIPEKPRDRYITQGEYKAVRSISPPLVQLMMDFAYCTGQRIGDILKIKLSDLIEDGILIKQNKAGAKIIIEWTHQLQECVNNVRGLPRSNLYSMTLFCNKKGRPLTYDGFSSVWDRVMKKALEENVIQERFTFNDLRAKTGSDALSLEHASQLLGHADSRITKRVYVRNYRKVKPII